MPKRTNTVTSQKTDQRPFSDMSFFSGHARKHLCEETVHEVKTPDYITISVNSIADVRAHLPTKTHTVFQTPGYYGVLLEKGTKMLDQNTVKILTWGFNGAPDNNKYPTREIEIGSLKMQVPTNVSYSAAKKHHCTGDACCMYESISKDARIREARETNNTVSPGSSPTSVYSFGGGFGGN